MENDSLDKNDVSEISSKLKKHIHLFNKNKIDVFFNFIKTKIKFAWFQIVAYPKSVLFYASIIYLIIFSKKSNSILKFGYSVGWWIFIPFILIMCLLIYAKKLNGKKFFINTSFSIFILYWILIFLLYKNDLSFLTFMMSLSIYSFYHAIFALLYILFSPQNFSKDKIPFIKNFYYLTLAAVILIIYYLLVATPLLRYLTNRQETINSSPTIFNYL